MSDISAPETIEIEEAIPRPKDVESHFQVETEDGKEYSRCLVADCGRRLPGRQLGNLETHLKVAHKIKSLLSSTTLATLKPTDSSVEYPLKQYLSESDDVRKYFETINVDGKLYMKCLLENCGRRISRNHLSNLKRHLKSYHDSFRNQTNSENEEDVNIRVVEDVNDTADIPVVENAIVNECDIRKYFRFTTEDGKLYAECQIRSCEARLADNCISSWKRHLQSHNVKVPTMPDAFNVNQYFQQITINGKLHSNCLFEGCDHRMTGAHAGNQRRHLMSVHKMELLTRSMRSVRLGKYFETIEADGESFCKCLINSCHQVVADKAKSQRRHLMRVHCITMMEDFMRRFAMKNRIRSSKRPEGASATANSALFGDESSTDVKPVENGTMSGEIAQTETLSNESIDARVQAILMVNSEVKKHFTTVDVDGKVYSRCTLDDCNHLMAGSHTSNLKRHLIRAHLKRKGNSMPQPNVQMSDDDESDASSTSEESRLSEVPRCEPDLLENIQKYFECVGTGDKIYQKCLVAGCGEKLAGWKRSNMKRHLATHRIVFYRMDGDIENVRRCFEECIESDRIFSKCLVKGCKANVVTGNHLSNLRRHLQNHHGMTQYSSDLCDEPTVKANEPQSDILDSEAISIDPRVQAILMRNSEVRMQFVTIDVAGKLHSRCTFDDCNHVMAGNHTSNFKRHLIRSHLKRKKSVPPLGEFPRCEPDEMENIQKYFASIETDGHIYQKCLIPGCEKELSGHKRNNMKRHLANHKIVFQRNDVRVDGASVRRCFEKCIKSGKIFSKCLVKGCRANVISGNHLSNLKRHLQNHHGMTHYSPDLCDEPTTEPNETRSSINEESINTYDNAVDDSFSEATTDSDDENGNGSSLWDLGLQLEKGHRASQFCSDVEPLEKTHDLPSSIIKESIEFVDSGDEGTNESSFRNLAQQSERAYDTDSESTAMCRLCFEFKTGSIDIFSDESRVAKIIRIHFPLDEVSSTTQFNTQYLVIFLFVFLISG